MILTCPECGTQYVVKDGAIPPQGRQVRCAACKHSWHQDPDPTEDQEPPAEVEPETIAEATLIEPRSGVEAEERAYEAAMIDTGGEAPHDVDAPPEPTPDDPAPVWNQSPVAASDAPASRFENQSSDAGPEPESAPADAVWPMAPEPVEAAASPADAPAPQPMPAPVQTGDWSAPPDPEPQQDDFSPFADPGEIAPRRRSPLLKLLLLVVIVAALVGAFWMFAPPEWKVRLGLAGTGVSPLALVTTHMDRQRLESGNELLTVTGRVVNPTERDQTVPPLQALLKTRSGKLVYRWTIPPPARTLAPGASADFNSTEVDVPPGGDELTITLGSGQV